MRISVKQDNGNKGQKSLVPLLPDRDAQQLLHFTNDFSLFWRKVSPTFQKGNNLLCQKGKLPNHSSQRHDWNRVRDHHKHQRCHQKGDSGSWTIHPHQLGEEDRSGIAHLERKQIGMTLHFPSVSQATITYHEPSLVSVGMAQGLCLLPFLKSLCFDTFVNQKVNDMHLCGCCLAKSFVLICQCYLKQVRALLTFSAASPDLFPAPLPIKQQRLSSQSSLQCNTSLREGFYSGMTLGRRRFLVKYPGWRSTAPCWRQQPEGPSSHCQVPSVDRCFHFALLSQTIYAWLKNIF